LLKLVDFGLVKQLAPDEMTVTVIQGRGTALYTPLEQYGGDAGHTDARSDIYAFGATLYHLITNHPPTEAKQRFLRPDALQPPRDLNAQIDPSIESAVLWAMELHPDNRPQDIESFRQALLAKVPLQNLIVRSRPPLLQSLLRSTVHRILIATTVVMLLIAVLATFI
jgi:serine/threonine-protein kinase